MHFPGTRRHAALALAALLLLVSAGLVQPAAGLRTAQPSNISYWGMNLYLTKGERRINNRDNLPALAALAQQSGMRWTREELPWDLIEPYNNNFISAYDSRLKQAADSGFGIVGMLLTTPGWARDPACSGSYWCPPANVQEYAQWAGWMAERYDGDGYADAPGSPRIAVWQIWNEQNHLETWPQPSGGSDARASRYGQLLVAAYQAIKAADPSATVVTGGVYVFDGSAGLTFMGDVFRLVPAARQAFDVFAIHPFMPTAAPDQPGLVRIVTLEGRIQNTRKWLNNDVGRPSAPLWISEIGWCTDPGPCPDNVAVDRETQANYLVRAMVIAQQNGVQHTSWFQFEDAFNGSSPPWGHAAIVENYNGASYPPKPAFYAYQTLASRLADAAPVGPGPLHTHTYNANDPYGGNDGGTYDYRYTLGSTIIDVLWRPHVNEMVQVDFPVQSDRYVTVLNRNGQDITASTNGGRSLLLSESPVLVIQSSSPPSPPQLVVAPQPLVILAEYSKRSTSTSGAFTVTNAGEGMLSWSASTGTSWLSLSAQSGIAPASVQVTASTAGRNVGSYQGSISITGSDGRQVTLPVELRVVERLHRLYFPLGRR